MVSDKNRADAAFKNKDLYYVYVVFELLSRQ